ncbi:MAG TPA: MarR family transcriptional regulator [Spirochaetota bacterium]|nr:MarR family transcriptional regulator [Spirochaetota bacterium]
MNNENTNQYENLYILINQTSLGINSVVRKALKNAGLTHINPAYIGILLCLWREYGLEESLAKLGTVDGMKIIDLGRCAGLEPSSMTGLIDRMERAGLVKREDDIHDRRVCRICLTQKGLSIRSDVIKIVYNVMQDSLSEVDKKSYDNFIRVLYTILDKTSKKRK